MKKGKSDRCMEHRPYCLENDRVQHWLNGYKILDYNKTSKSFKDAVALSKFSKTVPPLVQLKRSHSFTGTWRSGLHSGTLRSEVIKP